LIIDLVQVNTPVSNFELLNLRPWKILSYYSIVYLSNWNYRRDLYIPLKKILRRFEKVNPFRMEPRIQFICLSQLMELKNEKKNLSRRGENKFTSSSKKFLAERNNQLTINQESRGKI